MRRGIVARDLEKEFAGERVTVGVKPGGSKREHRIACLDALAVDDLLFIHDADDEARDIVFAVGIKAGHLGRLAAQQHATVSAASVGHALNNLCDRLSLK